MEYYNQQYFSNTENLNEPSKSTASVNPQPPAKENTTTTQGLNTRIINFLNNKTGNILTFAICFCIGAAFKDFTQSIVNNILEPLLIKILIATQFYDVLGGGALISEKNNEFKIIPMFASTLTFLITFLTVFFIFTIVSKIAGV